jgi:erythromycin esterase-like protein
VNSSSLPLVNAFTKPCNEIVAVLRHAARPFHAARPTDYDSLLKLIGDARFVLIGEASHGTHEFYRIRAEITKRLIKEKQFTAVAVEADWPDAYRVNRYVRRVGNDPDARAALAGFTRFPNWMWRNHDVLEFVEWLRAHNDSLGPDENRIGFYGLDLYSLYDSMEAVLNYLDKVDPEAAKRARYRYSCFDQFGEDTQAYGYAASFDLKESCEREVVSQLTELRHRAIEYARHDGRLASDEYFFAEQNARVVKNAEEYYRSMFAGRVSSWNLRDRHMADTLEHLVGFLAGQGQHAKIIVWEHNSHLGDARATEMGEGGELNVGQLVRERFTEQAVLIGFTTYTGTVTAASEWDGPAERKRVTPAVNGSYEALFHETGIAGFFLNLRDEELKPLDEPRLERAIGVIYRPETERLSHYFHARLRAQFDGVIHIDETQALEPLEPAPVWKKGHEAPETFPSGV